MHRYVITFTFLLGVGILLSGCSSPEDRYAARMKEGLKTLNELKFAFDKLKKNQNFGGTAPNTSEIGEVSGRLMEFKGKIDEAAPEDEKVKEKVLKYYSPFLENILANIAAEQAQLSSLGPENQKDMKACTDVLTAYKKLERPEGKKTTKK